MPASPKHNDLKLILTALIVPFFVLFFTVGQVQADETDKELEEIEEKLEKKEKEYQSTSKKLEDIRSKADGVSKKISDLSSQLNVTQAQINELEADIKDLEAQLGEINKNLEERRKSLAEKISLRNTVIRNYAKRGVLNELEIFLKSLPSSDLSLNGFQYATYSYIFEKSMTSETISLIGAINKEISSFEKDKKEAEDLQAQLKTSQSNLLAAKQTLDVQKAEQQGVLGDLEEQKGDLEEKLEDLSDAINDLTEKQQSIINAKSGGGNGTVGDYDTPSQKLPDPGFSPAFAASSYGAYTHGNGMSQYGAKGRAEAGKKYKEILKFYYKTDTKKPDSFPSKIKVEGYGEMDFQKYLYGLAEMPADWPMDALKAQAVAARTYAYRYIKAGKTICTTESCQVFLKSKSDKPPSKWKDAVDDTKGEILSGDTSAQYSSTTGGYINNVGWDTTGKWPDGAYEKKAGSPWFFKAWYTQTYNVKSSTCGRSSPWLNEKEMADVLNAWVVWRKGSGSEKDRISPVTTSCWGGNPYSMSDMAEKAEKYGSKFTSVSSDVDVEISNSGYTSKVTFKTNRGSVSIDGAEFKAVFNLRAPGYISIRNKLFDFVTK
jgi:peptidoglycan hydrolase-like amidase/uncharacterized protein YoxC